MRRLLTGALAVAAAAGALTVAAPAEAGAATRDHAQVAPTCWAPGR